MSHRPAPGCLRVGALVAVLIAGGGGACSDEPGTPSASSSGGGRTDAGRALDSSGTADSGVRVAQCSVDGQCVARFPDPPACDRARCVGGECKLLAAPDHTPCEDGNLCTGGDSCLGGSCREGDLEGCDDGQLCSDDHCDPTTGDCEHLPNDNTCSGDGGCSVGVCKDGSCASEPRLFERTVDLPAPGTAVDSTLVPGGPLLIAIQAEELASEVTRVVLLSLGAAGAGVQRATPLLPLMKVHALAVGGDGARVWLAGEVTASGGGVDAGAVAVSLAELKAGNAQGPSRSRTYGGGGHDALLAIHTAETGFVAAGATASKGSGQHDAWLIRGSPTGYPLLDFSYGSGDDEYAEAVVPLALGGYALAGRQIGKSGADGLIFVVDADAKLLWIRHAGGAFDDSIGALAQRDDGALAAAGRRGTSTHGASVAWLGLYSASGKLAWERIYPTAGAAWDRVVRIAGEPGALLLGGRTHAAEAVFGPALVVRLDGLGNPQWQRIWKEGGSSGLRGLAPLPDGFVGLAEAVTGLDARLTVVRADHYGHSSCALSGGCLDKGLGCQDSDPCTADGCTPEGGCSHAPVPDGSPCGDTKTCAHGVCESN